MGIIMLSLLGFSLLLLLISFFQQDPYKELKEELDQFTLQQVQEIYQLKKKLKVLEEELLLPGDDFPKSVIPVSRQQTKIHDIIKNQVRALAQQGKPIEQIATQSSLSTEDVYQILKESKMKGYES